MSKSIGIFGSNESFRNHGSGYDIAIPMLNKQGTINSSLTSTPRLMPIPKLFLTADDPVPFYGYKFQMARVLDEKPYYFEYEIKGWDVTNDAKAWDGGRYLKINSITEARRVSSDGKVMTRRLFDMNGHLLDETETTLVVSKAPQSPSATKRILLIGGSTTASGAMCAEVSRRMKTNTGSPTLTYNNHWYPNGYNLTNVEFAGTQTSSHPAGSGANSSGVRHEGYSGWAWSSFANNAVNSSVNNPFFNGGVLDFANYASKTEVGGVPDIVVFFMTWNSINAAGEFSQGQADARNKFINTLHAAWPNTRVYLTGMPRPSSNGGMLFSLGLGGTPQRLYDKYWWEHKISHQKFSAENNWIEYFDAGLAIDPIWGMGHTMEYPFYRRLPLSAWSVDELSKEALGGDYIHPREAGYHAIADGIVRAICHGLHQINNP